MIRPSEATRAAIVADYVAGMSTPTVAAKWGVGSASAHRYIKAAGVSRGRSGAQRRARERREAEFALTGGRWVQDGLVQRWQSIEETCTTNTKEISHAA